MTGGVSLCLALAACHLALAHGRTLRLAADYEADGRTNGSPLAMLATGSGVEDRSSAEHPLSWLFGFGDAPVSPAPLAMASLPAMPSPPQQVPLTPLQPGIPPGLGSNSPVGQAAPQQVVQPMGQLVGQPMGLPLPQPMGQPVLGITPLAPPATPLAAPAPGAIPLSALMPKQEPATPKPAAASDVAQMRSEIADLRQEVVSSNRDMWNAVKLIASTVEKDEATIQAVTQDVQTLRGRHGGSVPLVATECSMRQSSCSECVSVPSCVWCQVEQRCYSGDSAGPVRGECAFYRHGTCS